MKKIISLIGFLIYHTSILKRLLLFLSGNRYRILYYHIVTDNVPDYYFKDKGISVKDFKNQISYFKRFYKFINIEEAITKHEKGESLKGYMTITTDDGFIENYTIIAPYLKENNIPATFYLIDKCIDNKHLMWRNKLIYIQNTLGIKESVSLAYDFAEQNSISQPKKNENIMSWSKRVFSMDQKEILTDRYWNYCKMEPIEKLLETQKPYMSSIQIKELISQGFDLGAHSLTHPYSEFLGYDELEKEINESVDQIKQKFGVKVSTFSYPFGSRPSKDMEQRYIDNNKSKIKGLVGIKSNLKTNNPLKWERDLQELDKYEASFRFFVLPLLRMTK